jgi:hypothetical protein
MFTLFFLAIANLLIWRQQGTQKALIAILLVALALVLLIVIILIPANMLVVIWSSPQADWWWFKAALWLTLNDELIYNICVVVFSACAVFRFRENINVD